MTEEEIYRILFDNACYCTTGDFVFNEEETRKVAHILYEAIAVSFYTTDHSDMLDEGSLKKLLQLCQTKKK